MGIYIDVTSMSQYEENVSELFLTFEKVVYVMEAYFIQEHNLKLDFIVDAIFDYSYHDRFNNAKFMNSNHTGKVISDENKKILVEWLTQN